MSDGPSYIRRAAHATSALFARERLGVGQALDISLYDTAVTNLSYMGYQCLATGEEPRRFPRQAPLGGPAGYFRTADGNIIMVVNNDRDLRSICMAIGRSDMAEDPRLQSYAGRQKNLSWMNESIEAPLVQQPRTYWMARLREGRIPSGAVCSVAEAMRSDLAAERKLVTGIPHAVAGLIPNIGCPLRMSYTPPARPAAAPLLGEHTARVLREFLGYDESKIERICRVAQSTASDAL